MNTLNLEISEKEFVIKLDRSIYTVSAMQSLIKRIQNEHNTFSYTQEDSFDDIRSHINDRFDESYDHLSEK